MGFVGSSSSVPGAKAGERRPGLSMDPAFGEDPMWDYARMRMTTRRFCERPARVLFGLTGLSSPQRSR